MYEDLKGGPVTSWLAIIGVISLIYWACRIAAALWGGRRKATDAAASLAIPATAAAPRAAPLAAPAEDIAVIAAAAYAVLGAHRIVHLEAIHPEPTWAVEGRWMQQTSHRPR